MDPPPPIPRWQRDMVPDSQPDNEGPPGSLAPTVPEGDPLSGQSATLAASPPGATLRSVDPPTCATGQPAHALASTNSNRAANEPGPEESPPQMPLTPSSPLGLGRGSISAGLGCDATVEPCSGLRTSSPLPAETARPTPDRFASPPITMRRSRRRPELRPTSWTLGDFLAAAPLRRRTGNRPSPLFQLGGA
ncbi:hypothetical protein ZWY2020_007088 [Hordeum vulgare]|nr:hypothetical protein ZWY2020_007088 [Hordeum vulgare]